MMWYDRVMVVWSQRPRLWPFLLVAFLGVFWLSLSLTTKDDADQTELTAVELLK